MIAGLRDGPVHVALKFSMLSYSNCLFLHTSVEWWQLVGKSDRLNHLCSPDPPLAKRGLANVKYGGIAILGYLILSQHSYDGDYLPHIHESDETLCP